MHRRLLLVICLFLIGPAPLLGEPKADASPKQGWGDLEVVEIDEELPIWAEVLLWPVNRVLDLIDVVRLDAGIGTSRGGVVRLSRYANIGERNVAPGSLRLGVFGRDLPIRLEEQDEGGAFSDYRFSADREVCSAEFGLGLDLIVGGYVGLCLDELPDLAGGIFFLDPSDDDIR